MALFGPRATEVAVVSPPEAAALREAGAVLVDARPLRQRLGRGVGAGLVLGWRATCRGRGRESRLPEDRAALGAALRTAGVPEDGWVVVVDAGAGGWGEGARVAWVLGQLGHPRAAWLAADARSLGDTTPGRLPPEPTPPPRGKGRCVLDVRSPREFRGATPYGEARGGHLSGACSLPFAALWTPDGAPRAPDELRATLQAIGVDPGARLQCVCTGGVRSAAATLLLRRAGVDAENDAGGMWFHAADQTITLERGPGPTSPGDPRRS